MIGKDDLHRLRQMRDDLDWLLEHAEQASHSPYNHYTETIRSTRGVVGSLIGNLTDWKTDA